MTDRTLEAAALAMTLKGEAMIAALFVETDGCYFGLPGVDPWDVARDARDDRRR